MRPNRPMAQVQRDWPFRRRLATPRQTLSWIDSFLASGDNFTNGPRSQQSINHESKTWHTPVFIGKPLPTASCWIYEEVGYRMKYRIFFFLKTLLNYVILCGTTSSQIINSFSHDRFSLYRFLLGVSGCVWGGVWVKALLFVKRSFIKYFQKVGNEKWSMLRF